MKKILFLITVTMLSVSLLGKVPRNNLVKAGVVSFINTSYSCSYEYIFSTKTGLHAEVSKVDESRVLKESAMLMLKKYIDLKDYNICLGYLRNDYWHNYVGFFAKYTKGDIFYKERHLPESVEKKYSLAVKALFVGANIGFDFFASNDFTFGARLGYGIPFGQFKWKDGKPTERATHKKDIHQVSASIDFNLTIGYRF